MACQSKRFLKKEAVHTTFSFVPETGRKRWECSRCVEEKAKKLCIKEAISSHEACSSHVCNEDGQGLELLQKSASPRSP